MLSFAICMVIAVAVPFVLTVMLGKKKTQLVEVNAAENVNAVEVVKAVKSDVATTELKAFGLTDHH